MSQAAFVVFCFAHVGGSALVYRAWQRLCAGWGTVVPVELPGHTARMKEPLVSDLDALADQLGTEIEAELARRGAPQWATYGHCTGGPLSFLVAERVARRTGRAPLRSFVAASRPPDRPIARLGDFSDEQLLCLLDRVAGTPAGLMRDARMRDLMLPVLRADAQINDACFTDHGVRAHWPLTVFAARDDADLQPDDLWGWERFTTAGCRRVLLGGGHFHALHAPQEALAHMRSDLAGDALRAAAPPAPAATPAALANAHPKETLP